MMTMQTTTAANRRLKRYLVAILLACLLAVLSRGHSGYWLGQKSAVDSTPDSVLSHSGVRQTLEDYALGPLDSNIKRQSDNEDPHHSNPPSDQDPSNADGGDDDEEWDNCVTRGCKLNELMKTPNADLQERYKSKWTKFDDIKKYGWSLSTDEAKAQPNDDERTSSAPLLQALKIPGLDDPSWKKVAWVHETESKVDGKTYPATDSEYINFYNPAHGIIIAADNRSPLKNTLNIPPDKVIPLNRWSDIVYLTWIDVCQIHSQSPGDLKYVLRMNIISDDASPILSKIVGSDLAEFIDSYPGVSAPGVPDSQIVRAAIGFSNGRGVAWLLIQHKDTFGDTRFIHGVTIWDSYNGHRPPDLLPGLDEIPNVLFTLS